MPAGIYGKAALTRLGVWEQVAGRVAAAENVRAALALVARGEAPLGIVYKTDAAIEPGVKIVGTFPDDTHQPIVYPMALTVGPVPTRHPSPPICAARRRETCSRNTGSPCSIRSGERACSSFSPEELTAIRLSLWVAVLGDGCAACRSALAVALAAGARPVLGQVAAQRASCTCRWSCRRS